MRRAATRPIALFDDRRARLGPLADLRPPWDIRTAALTIRERIEAAIGPVLAFFAAESGPPEFPTTDAPVLVVSGRAALLPPEIGSVAPGDALVEPGTGDLISALIPPASLPEWVDAGMIPPEGAKRVAASQPCLLRRPWDVIRYRDAALASDLQRIVRDEDRPESTIPAGVTHFGEHTAAIDFTASLPPGVTLDTSRGPIVLCAGSVVRPGAIIVGPAYIGPGSHVLERALIKAGAAVGPMCKVAGEVGGTIFQGHSNKSHDGHLGDSWVGEWVNLGAGTTNSNLLNTYDEVVARVEPDAPSERTGLTFLGAIIGDHVKTAIATRLMTGSVIGTGAMIASTQPPPTCVRRFAWLTDAGEQTFRLDKFLDTARRVMSRRDRALTAEDERRIGDLYARSTGVRA